MVSRDTSVIASVKERIAKEFKIIHLGRAQFILGIEIDHDMGRKRLSINQRTYTESVIKRFSQEDAKPSLVPIDPSYHPTKEDDTKRRQKRRTSLIGPSSAASCIWLAVQVLTSSWQLRNSVFFSRTQV